MRTRFQDPSLCAALALCCLALGPTAVAAQQSDRELSGIAEEQALLSRQLQRLRLTMENLIPRLEQEGRSHALELLRQGLTLLDERSAEAGALTIEELMDAARDGVESGRAVQSLERQEAVIKSLERLIAVLTDRESLEHLDSNIEALRALRERLRAMSAREQRLEQDTRELRQDAADDAQRALESELERLAERQRELLREGEEAGRRAGTFEREQIERELESLLERQRVDRAVLESWSPAEHSVLESTFSALDDARREVARGERLRKAARLLRETAGQARSAAGPEAIPPLAAGLDSAAEREERALRASLDEAARAAAQALRTSAEELRALAADAASREQAASALEQRAAELEALAREADSAADTARAQALAALSAASARKPDSGPGQAADRARTELEQAQAAAAAGGQSPEDAALREEDARAPAAAQKEVQQALDDAKRLGPAVSASQSENARDAERLARGVESLSRAAGQESPPARTALDRAADSMRAAAESARGGQAQSAAAAALEAERALSEALGALGAERERAASASEETGSGRAGELSQAQSELAARAASARSQSGSAGLGAEETSQAEQALDEAREAMERAAQEIEGGRSASAAGSQREALQALRRAQEAVSGGVQPATPEQLERAEELASEQAEIERELLELARLDRDRRKASLQGSLDRAAEAATRAKQSLGEGELDQSVGEEQEVQRQLARAEEELSEEEQQYQRLRQEELLFRIAEEMTALIEGHRSAMQAVREVEAARAPSERPSRAERLRLRRIGGDEAGLSGRAGEIAQAIEEEASLVFAHVLRESERDLARIAELLDEKGGWQSGERVQTLQEDVEESFEWVLEALKAEQRRRQEEERDPQPGGQQGEQPPSKNRLVPDSAELKLLRRMEVETLERLDRLVRLNPEISEQGAEVEPGLADDVLRLAERHERTTRLFEAFRRRLGLPDPPELDEPVEPEKLEKP